MNFLIYKFNKLIKLNKFQLKSKYYRNYSSLLNKKERAEEQVYIKYNII